MPPACPGGPTPFGSSDVYDAVALIRAPTPAAVRCNLEVIARTGNRLDTTDDDANPFPWHGPFAIPGASGALGPALIQAISAPRQLRGRRRAGGGSAWALLACNDAANLPWHGPTAFGSTEVYDAVALIQSNFSTAGSGPGTWRSSPTPAAGSSITA